MKNFTIYNSRIGYIRIDYYNDKIYYLKKYTLPIDNMGQKCTFTDYVYNELEEYFEGKRKFFSFEYVLEGTVFQRKVWNMLCTIPYGETRSYKDIAIAIGNKNACRAVGMANNKNPITIAVPCHRVIGKNGNLIGYAGGLEMKKYLLDLEERNR